MTYRLFCMDSFDVSSLHSTSSSCTASSSRSHGMTLLKSLTCASDICQWELLATLGEGPTSFGPACFGVTVQEGLQRCSHSEIERFLLIKLKCEHHRLDITCTDEQILRVAFYKRFSVGKSIRLLRNMDSRMVNTTAKQLLEQLRTKTLFPLPRLSTEFIDHFFYMKPSRYSPKETPVSTIIANLIYTMDTIYERTRNSN